MKRSEAGLEHREGSRHAARALARAGDDAPIQDWVDAWVVAGDLECRRGIEARIAEALREPLAESARTVLQRFGGAMEPPDAEDVVGQTVIELPAILGAYVDGAGRSGAGGFIGYVLGAARNIACDMLSHRRRERSLLQRLSSSRPSRFGRVPTTPSEHGIRAEVRDLLQAEFARIDAVDREIIRRHVAGQGFAEIGRELGLPSETVRDRFHSHMARLQRVVGRSLGGDPFSD